MFHTRSLLVLVGDETLTTKAKEIVRGFHAVSIIPNLSEAAIKNIYAFNKNAVFFASSIDAEWEHLNPYYVWLTTGETRINTIAPYVNVNNIIKDLPKIYDQWEIDLGDHSSQDSNGLCNQTTDECLMCRIYRRKVTTIEHRLFESKHFYCIPGTGAFFEGYIMIVPKRHILSVARMDPEELEDFFMVLGDMRFLLTRIYQKRVFAFECASGRTGAGKHKTSIVHAHVHLAPTDMPVLDEVIKSGVNPWPINPSEFCNYGENPYMLYITQNYEWYIIDSPQTYFPRQHPRQVLANWMNDYEHYNWRLYPMREKMDVIANEFRTYCKRNWHSLSARIKRNIRFEDYPIMQR